MMSVLEYAEDVNKKVEEVLEICSAIGIKVNNKDDMLNEDDITELDNFKPSIDKEKVEENIQEHEEEVEDSVDEELEEMEVVVDNKKVNNDFITKKEKLKKKIEPSKSQTNKKELAGKKKEMYKNKEKLMSNTSTVNEDVVIFKDRMTVSGLASALNVSPAELIKKLFMLGIMATLNNEITYESAEILVVDYKKELKREALTDVTNFEEYEIIDSADDLGPRPPVVTIMGHVDHGKTSLLDAIRKTNVVEGEAGGITQAISAYQIKYNDRKITFIDTPGHAAFTEMRARGAGITDIVIIIVAADDGVMPQTKEAIDHAKAANVPILVAINKIDKPGSKLDRIMTELNEMGLTPEEWGGDTIFCKISAKTGEGLDELLENLILIADVNEYKANPSRYAVGTVIESRLDKQVGSIVTILVQNGTLRLGDPIVVGSAFGKVRTLRNDKNEEILEAGPSRPVEITGLNDTPSAGDKFMAFESEKEARNVGEQRKTQAKQSDLNPSKAVTLEDLFSQIQDGKKEINIIIKADVNGSAEAVKNSLEKIEVEGVHVKVVRSSVGAITEGDIVLSKAVNGLIIGFNVRPNNHIKDYAKENGIELRLYNIIYKAVEEMEAAMKGMLDPEFEEKVIGTAEIRQLFKFSKVGNIAGSYVTDGIIKANAKARIIRDDVVIYDGQIGSMQREKNQVKDVKKGLECGITIENYNDIKVGDVVEAYEMVEKKR